MFLGNKVEDLSLCSVEIKSCAVKTPLNEGCLLFKPLYRPHSGTILKFIEARESYCDHPELLNSKNSYNS